MRVLYTNFHPGNGGGHTTYLTYLFNGILSQDTSVEAFMAAPKVSKLNRDLRRTYPDRVFDVDFPGKPKEIISALSNAKKLKKLIIDQQIDIVHVNGTPDHKVVMLCKWLYRLDFCIVRTKHDSFPIKENWFANKLYGKYTDQMVVVSNYQFEHVITQSLQNKTTVIHNGVNLDYFKPRDKSKILLQKYDIQKGDLVLVSVAGTALHKGWQLLVEAASKLEDSQRKKIKIILAGNMPKPETVEQYINAFGMQDQVIFTGFMDDVREVISIADVGFVLSIGVETISFACREMMAMGKPVLASDYAGLPENIIDNQDGWITTGSANKVYEKLKQIIGFNLDQYADCATQKAKQSFGLENFVRTTTNIYSKS